MALNVTQITVLHWFYQCHAKGEPASYKGSIQHFGEVLKISDPMSVILSLLEMGFMSNPEEDRLMNTDSYRDKLAAGVYKGIKSYFTE